MSSNKSDQSVYAAGQAREFLAGALEGKENHWIREYAGLIDDPEVLDWLNYKCSIYSDFGEDFLETRQAQLVIRSAATRAADAAFKDGKATQLQGLVGLVKHERDAAQDAIAETVDHLEQEGCVALVVGPPGAGKTATTLDVARAWGVRTGGSIFGNTGWGGFDDVVETDVALLEAMASVDGPTLGVIDETNQNLSGEGADNVKASAFVDRATFIRKKEGEHGPHAKRGSLVLVGHTFKKTAADIRRLATLIVQKPSRKDPGRLKLFTSEGGKDDRELVGEFKGLTDTRESYREHEASEFDVVLEPDDDGDDVDVDDVRYDKDVETAIRAVLKGDSQAEAAEMTDYGRGWAGERWREWKRGQHRDLVDVPDPLPDHVAEDEIVTD